MKKSGRKFRYGEPTVAMRIPESLVPTVEKLLETREVLTTQWEGSMLPPAAEKLVQRISELMQEAFKVPQEAIADLAMGKLEGLSFLSEGQRNELIEELLNDVRVQKVIGQINLKREADSIARSYLIDCLSEVDGDNNEKPH